MQPDDRMDDKRPAGRAEVMATFFASDEFLNGFVLGMLVLLILSVPVEMIRERRRGR